MLCADYTNKGMAPAQFTAQIAGYANLSQAAMTSMKIIADSVTKWKSQSPPSGESQSPL